MTRVASWTAAARAVAAVAAILGVWLGASAGGAEGAEVRVVNLYPNPGDGHAAIEALVSTFDQGNLTASSTTIPMPAARADYKAWLVMKDGADVLPWYPLGLTHEIYSNEYFVDVSDVYEDTGLVTDLPPAVKAACRGPNGRTVGVPLHGTTVVCVHRRSLFSSLGLRTPTSWSGLLSLCQTVLGAGIPFCIATDNAAHSPTPIADYLIARMHGTALYQAFSEGMVSFEDPRVRASLLQFAFLRESGYFVTTSENGNLPDATSLASNTSALYCGFHGTTAGVVAAGAPLNDLASFEFPHEYDGPGRTAGPGDDTNMIMALIGVLGIPKASDNVEAARAFLRHAARASTMTNVTLPAMRTSVPLRKSVGPLITNPNAAAAFALFASEAPKFYSPTRLSFWVASEVSREWGNLLKAIVRGSDGFVDAARLDIGLPRLEALRLNHHGVTSRVVPSLAPGMYRGRQTLSLSCLTAGAVIMYSTSGSPLDSNVSLLYRQPLELEVGETIVQAMAIANGLSGSEVTEWRYDIRVSVGPGVSEPGAANAAVTVALAVSVSLVCLAVVVSVVLGLLYRRVLQRSRFKVGTSSKEWVIAESELELDARVGQGAYGVVYRGGWRSQTVAVKRLVGEQSFSTDAVAQFVEEVKMVMRLRHRHVLLVYGVVLEPLSLVSEYMRHGSLFEQLHDPRVVLSPGIVTRWAYEMARGLQFLGKSGVVHGDIKSTNMLLDDQYVIKIGDFGLAAMLGTMESGPLVAKAAPQTQRDGEAGTLFWSAPEVLDKGMSAVSFKSDVYAYAITLWETATRENLYAGMTMGQACLAVMGGQRPATTHIQSEFPELVMLMESMWKDAADERASFDDAVRILDPLVAGTESAMPRSSLTVSSFWVTGTLVGAEANLVGCESDAALELIVKFHETIDELRNKAQATLDAVSIGTATFELASIRQVWDFMRSTGTVRHAGLLWRLVRWVIQGDATRGADMASLLESVAAREGTGEPDSVVGLFVDRTVFDDLDSMQFLMGRDKEACQACEGELVRLTIPMTSGHMSSMPQFWALASGGSSGSGSLELVPRSWMEAQTNHAVPNLRPLWEEYEVSAGPGGQETTTMIKLLLEQQTLPVVIAQFVGLLKAMARVGAVHESLVGPVGVCLERPTIGYIEPRLGDTTLAQRLSKGLIELSDVKAIAGGILCGLDALHTHTKPAMTHGSLEPFNVMLDGTTVYLTGFGLRAVALHAISFSTVKHLSAQYVSPEELTGGTYTSASDMFVFGLILYEMVSGARAFDEDNETFVTISRKISQVAMPSVTQLRSQELGTMIQACWAGDPAERPSAGELLEKLRCV